MGEQSLERTIVEHVERLKAQFANTVQGFAVAHGVDEIKIADVRFRYGDWADNNLILTCEVSVADMPEKQQVPLLRTLEAAWKVPNTGDGRRMYRRSKYHPTSKLHSRRLQLEQSVSIRL